MNTPFLLTEELVLLKAAAAKLFNSRDQRSFNILSIAKPKAALNVVSSRLCPELKLYFLS